jgi:hypothetical protein
MKEVQMRRVIILSCVFLLFLAVVGCSGNETRDTYMGKQVTLSLQGGVDQLKGKVIDLKINEYITLEDDNYIFTINLNDRKYRLVMEKEENK